MFEECSSDGPRVLGRDFFEVADLILKVNNDAEQFKFLEIGPKLF
jgi:hypothetical protein